MIYIKKNIKTSIKSDKLTKQFLLSHSQTKHNKPLHTQSRTLKSDDLTQVK